jgi:hypothetical protein
LIRQRELRRSRANGEHDRRVNRRRRWDALRQNDAVFFSVGIVAIREVDNQIPSGKRDRLAKNQPFAKLTNGFASHF